jgi:hypothetical protein
MCFGFDFELEWLLVAMLLAMRAMSSFGQVVQVDIKANLQYANQGCLKLQFVRRELAQRLMRHGEINGT